MCLSYDYISYTFIHMQYSNISGTMDAADELVEV